VSETGGGEEERRRCDVSTGAICHLLVIPSSLKVMISTVTLVTFRDAHSDGKLLFS